MSLTRRPSAGLMTLALLSVCLIAPSAAAQEAAIEWDTIFTHEGMYTGNPPGVECVGLVVSNHGEMGHAGLGRVNMDYAESGLECGTRPEDAVYLYSGSPFVILADDASGTNASLTCSYGDIDGTGPCAWVPTGEPRSKNGGFSDLCPIRLPQFSAMMMSKEGAIALERFFFVPLNDDADTSFIVAVTKIYSHDGLHHPHITVGSVTGMSLLIQQTLTPALVHTT